MSKRDWCWYAQTGLGIVFVGLFVFVVAFGVYALVDQRKKRESSQPRTQQYSEDALKSVPEAGVGVVRRQKAPPSDQNPKREEWRQEQDLKAQWKQAKWAKYAAIAGFLSAFVTGFGVWYVKQTLDATRAALREAKTSSDAAVLMAQAMVSIERPVLYVGWGVVEMISVGPREEGEDERPIGGIVINDQPEEHSMITEIPIRNYGRTASFLMSVSMGHEVTKELPPEPTFTKTITLNTDTTVLPEPREDAVNAAIPYRIDLTREEIGALQRNETYLWVFCSILYRNFLNQPLEDRFCARWAQRPASEGVCYFASDGNPPATYTKRGQPKEQAAQT